MNSTTVVKKLRSEYPHAQSIVPSSTIQGGWDVIIDGEFETEFWTFKQEGSKLRLIGLITAEN